MKRVTLGMSLAKTRELYDNLGGQINAADARLAQGQGIDGMIEIDLSGQSNSTVDPEPIEVAISNDDMERPEVRDTVFVDLEVTD